MSDSTRNIEILSANFIYLGGSIEVVVRPSFKRYQFGFGCGEKLWIAEWDRNEKRYGKSRSITEDDAVKLLGERHWSWNDFVCVWQGWASGKGGRLDTSVE